MNTYSCSAPVSFWGLLERTWACCRRTIFLGACFRNHTPEPGTSIFLRSLFSSLGQKFRGRVRVYVCRSLLPDSKPQDLIINMKSTRRKTKLSRVVTTCFIEVKRQTFRNSHDVPFPSCFVWKKNWHIETTVQHGGDLSGTQVVLWRRQSTSLVIRVSWWRLKEWHFSLVQVWVHPKLASRAFHLSSILLISHTERWRSLLGSGVCTQN